MLLFWSFSVISIYILFLEWEYILCAFSFHGRAQTKLDSYRIPYIVYFSKKIVFVRYLVVLLFSFSYWISINCRIILMTVSVFSAQLRATSIHTGHTFIYSWSCNMNVAQIFPFFSFLFSFFDQLQRKENKWKTKSDFRRFFSILFAHSIAFISFYYNIFDNIVS